MSIKQMLENSKMAKGVLSSSVFWLILGLISMGGVFGLYDVHKIATRNEPIIIQNVLATSTRAEASVLDTPTETSISTTTKKATKKVAKVKKSKSTKKKKTKV